MAYTKTVWENGDVITKEKLNNIENGIANAVGGGSPMESITHAALLAKCNSGTLIPGMQYRITDYECTCTYERTRVVSHPFDIIVTADDEHTLNRNARACLHDGDNYYSNYQEDYGINLNEWELKYCINNDNDGGYRYPWVDENNGKGVIYYMKDDFGNEMGYDFKQIQFQRYKITDCSVPSLIDSYFAFVENQDNITIDVDHPVWFYTFSYLSEENDIITIEDGSLNGMACDNYGKYITPDNENVFIGDCFYNILGQVFKNTFLEASAYNVLKDSCFYNIFGEGCQNNILNFECSFNFLGNGCSSNIFGDNCSNNSIGNNCEYNTFGNNCEYNTLERGCQRNTFGNNCEHNTLIEGDRVGTRNNIFGDGCNNNYLSGDCCNNIFGNGCDYNNIHARSKYNTFGDICYDNLLPVNSLDNVFENECMYIKLVREDENDTVSPLIYYHILSGTQGSNSNSKLEITCTLNNPTVTYAGKNSSGELVTWVPADLVTSP